MNSPEGFFPEREILAMRRALARREPESTAVAKSNGNLWVVLFACFAPSWIPSLVPLLSREHAIALTVCFVTLALIVAIAGIVYGIWRGLRRSGIQVAG